MGRKRTNRPFAVFLQQSGKGTFDFALHVDMLLGLFGNARILLLAVWVLGGLVLLYFLAFGKYSRQQKIRRQRLARLEKLVTKELERSRVLSGQAAYLDRIREGTDEKLEVIKLQVAAMKKGEENSGKMPPS